MTEFLRIDHVQLGMPPGAESAARAFYGDVLGLALVSPPAVLSGLWFRAGEVELHLNVEADYRATRRVHPALEVRGLDELVRRCEAAGFAAREDRRYPGRQRYYVADPFGNQIELFERVAAGEGAAAPD